MLGMKMDCERGGDEKRKERRKEKRREREQKKSEKGNRTILVSAARGAFCPLLVHTHTNTTHNNKAQSV